jgi:hypothetical protein
MTTTEHEYDSVRYRSGCRAPESEQRKTRRMDEEQRLTGANTTEQELVSCEGSVSVPIRTLKVDTNLVYF